MKQYSLSILFTILTLICVGCNNPLIEPMIVDWAPVNLYFYVEDPAGNDLLHDSISDVTLEFKGEVYHLPSSTERTQTAYMPHMYGLRFQAKNTEYLNPTNMNRLIFGEIDGAATMDEDIIITWPDGSKNTIHYHCSDHVEWPEIDCKREWKLDGEVHDGNYFEFVKKHL